MKKTNIMTGVLCVVAVLLMVACTKTQIEETTAPSSSGGAVQENTLFGPGTQASGSQSSSSQPSSAVTTPSTSTSQPATSVPGTSAPATSAPATSAPATSEPATSAPVTSAPQTSTGATEPPASSQPETPNTPVEIDYETFKAMTGAEQMAYQNSFPSLDAFFDWYNAAKEAYEQANPPIEIGGSGVVDMSTMPTNP